MNYANKFNKFSEQCLNFNFASNFRGSSSREQYRNYLHKEQEYRLFAKVSSVLSAPTKWNFSTIFTNLNGSCHFSSQLGQFSGDNPPADRLDSEKSSRETFCGE